MSVILKKIIISFVITAAVIANLTADASVTCKVKNGESLWSIAKRYEISLGELLKANPKLPKNGEVKPGDLVNIPSETSLATVEDEVIRLVNVERGKRNLMLLKKNDRVRDVARLKSRDMIDKNYFAHHSPTYGSPFNMMENFGIKFVAAGENIAYGQKTAREVVNSWMDSPGHRANILSGVYMEIGVGAAKKANGTLYWTQLFIKPR